MPAPARELPESWNLMKAIHHLQGAKQAPAFSQAIVENWSLNFSFVWTGNDFESVLRDAKNDMEAGLDMGYRRRFTC